MMGMLKIQELNLSWMCTVGEFLIMINKNRTYFPFLSLGVSSPSP